MAFVFVSACFPCLVLNSAAEPTEDFEDPSVLIHLSPGVHGKDIELVKLLPQELIHTLVFVILMWLCVRSYAIVKKRSIECSLYKLDASDYTVMLSGVPVDFNDEDIREFIENFVEFRDSSFEYIAAINRTYDIREKFKLSRNSHMLKRSLSRARTVAKKQEIAKSMETLEIAQEKQDVTVLEKVNSIVFVTFTRMRDAHEVLESNRTTFFSYLLEFIYVHLFRKQTKRCVKGRNIISFSNASYPTDITWENLSITIWSQFSSTLLSFLASIILLTLVSALFAYIRLYQNALRRETSEDDAGFWVYSIAPSLLITVINLSLEVFLELVTKFELHLTTTRTNISITRKLIILLFVNTAVIPLVVNTAFGLEWFENIGLLNDVFMILIFNSVIPPLFYLLN